MALNLDRPVVLIGAGKMGGALLTGWLSRDLPASQVRVQDPGPPADVKAELDRHGLKAEPSIGALPTPPAVVVLAVKPQVMDAVLPSVKPLIGRGTLVLSVAAGRTIAGLAKGLPQGTAIVRSIPNTPAAIGRGITVATAGANVSGEQKTLAGALLEAVGEVGWVDDEKLIDAATAVSGSGPAYVFLLAEALREAAVAQGLPAELADRLARATVSGAGELLRVTGLDPATLRQNVTSPNGTTAAALAVLMAEPGLTSLMKAAVAAAERRSRELAS